MAARSQAFVRPCHAPFVHMPPELSSRCGFGLVSGRPLFLDLKSDSYFLLEPEEERRWLAHGGNGGRATRVTRPARSLLSRRPGRSRPRLAEVAGLARLILRTRRALARRPLAQLVDEALAPPTVAPKAHDPAIAALRFRDARRWIPIESHCLTDSLALLTYLRDRGQGAMLVFGAKLDPFAAHCWLQAGDLLLNDSIDRIEIFTPVLAIGE